MPNLPVTCEGDQPCSLSLSSAYLVDIAVEKPLSTALSDCSVNFLLLTDDAGATSAEDTAPFLTKERRSYTFSSAASAKAHYTACTRTGFELASFFEQQVGPWKRNHFITVGLIAEGETLEEAAEAVHACFSCFTVVTHVHYKKDDTPYFDSEEQLALNKWALGKELLVTLPSMNYASAIEAEDSSSIAAKAKEAGLFNGLYFLSRDVCTDELDAECKPTGKVVTTTGTEHIAAAAVLTSVSAEAPDHYFTLTFKPLGGVGIPRSNTSSLTAEEAGLAIGANAQTGVNPESKHHFNVYHKVESLPFLLSGLTATGAQADVILHRFYTKRALTAPIIELLSRKAAVSALDTAELEAVMLTVITRFERQGFMISKEFDPKVDSERGQQLALKGKGWALIRTIDSRSSGTPSYVFCYIGNDSIQAVNLRVADCDLAPTTK